MANNRDQQARERLRLQREHERLVNQQRREAERARQQAEREQREQHVARQQQEAERLSTQARERAEELGGLLVDSLDRAVLDFDRMRLSTQPAPFQPGPIGQPAPAPQWEAFAPRPPGAFARLFGGEGRHRKAEQLARQRYEQEVAAHQQREQQRVAEVQRLQQQHEHQEGERLRHAAEHNEGIAGLERDFRAGAQESVERCLELCLESEELPAGVPADVEVGYRPDARQVLVLRELPDTGIIPAESAFKYVKSRDAIESSARKPAEIRNSYADLIAQLALLTLHDVFRVTTDEQVTEVTVNCRLATTDTATGQAIHPCLLTVGAKRADFAELVLDNLDAQRCLKRLNALMSPHPYDAEAVKPIFDPDLDRFRTIDAHDAASALDSRVVLVEQSPTEFEHLVRQLFEAMGMKSWVTQASRDDGVDAVAVNEDPIMGGLAVIQAKRYKNVVPADASRALWGVMEDKKAGTGVLVATSYFGKATHDFAARNERIRLIEGPELKHLLKEHLDLDVVIGAKIPNRKN